MLKARNARDVLMQAMLAAPMFEVRFRHVATRALAVMRSSRGKKVPAWIQRLRSQELLVGDFSRPAGMLRESSAARSSCPTIS